jgi:Leucine-rich repeat (LRR) protein
MQEFSAGQNKLAEVPQAVCQWKELKRLDLHKNALEGLPACMGALTKVEVLDLWSNDLGEYPDELSGMASVKFIDLRVIQYDQEEMERITTLFPRAKIYFSEPCNCGHP